MSTRFPSLIDASHIVASAKKQMHFATTDWTDRNFVKARLVDMIFVGMILLSVVGLTYAWLH